MTNTVPTNRWVSRCHSGIALPPISFMRRATPPAAPPDPPGAPHASSSSSS